MTDCVERQAVREAMLPLTNGNPILWSNIKRAISAIPASDVAQVRHGRWVIAKGSWCTPGGDPVWECSECGKGRHVYGVEHGSYGSDIADGQWIACPNCGAKMD